MGLADLFGGVMSSGSTPDVKDYFNDLNTPEVSEMELQLQQQVQQGLISPEEAQTILQQRSEMNNISLDPNLKKSQMDALMGLQEITDGGGLTAMDQANLQRIKSEEDSAARGKREAIIQGAQQRGMGGSGLELMSQMQNQQDSATRASQRGLDVAGMAQERALQALMQQGEMAGKIQGQDFNQQAQVAGANDAISRFNAQNKQGVINQNVGARNDAQAANLNAKQNISNANVNTANQQQINNKELIQRQYDNELKKRQGQAGIASANAQAQGANSTAQANANNQMLGTAITAGAMLSDERSKTDIEEIDPGDFLDSITGYKFKYKDKKHGEGNQIGVMAQDLEKTEAGARLVSETPEGKAVDYSKAGPQIMASLASLNKRLKDMEGEEA